MPVFWLSQSKWFRVAMKVMKATHEGRCEHQKDLQACGRLGTSTIWSLTLSRYKERERNTYTRRGEDNGLEKTYHLLSPLGIFTADGTFSRYISTGMANKSTRATHYLKPNTRRVPKPKSFVLTLQASHFHHRIGGLADTNQEKPGSQLWWAAEYFSGSYLGP